MQLVLAIIFVLVLLSKMNEVLMILFFLVS
jgi:hypothetical protein